MGGELAAAPWPVRDLTSLHGMVPHPMAAVALNKVFHHVHAKISGWRCC